MSDIYKLFEEEIWKPEDYTNCFWYETSWGMAWSEEYEKNPNPEDWEDSYSTDRVQEKTVRDGYMLVTVSDDCGGYYQAIFDLSKKVSYT